MNRLDKELFIKGLFESRTRATEEIKSGHVKVNGTVIKKPSHLVSEQDLIEVIGIIHNFVSRGGLKLQKMVEECNIDLRDKICLDIGASTGGFTDYMLQQGAKFVYSVDVGTNQLHPSLKEHSNVFSMEQTNILDCDKNQFLPIHFITIDVSFVSILRILEHVVTLAQPHSEFVCLIKPQFEVGRKWVGKQGIVKDKKAHIMCLDMILSRIRENFDVHGLIPSPIQGGDGNIEYLIYFKKEKSNLKFDVNDIVRKAFER